MPVRRLGGSSLHVSVCSSQTSGLVARNARRSTERTLEPLGAGGAVPGGESGTGREGAPGRAQRHVVDEERKRPPEGAAGVGRRSGARGPGPGEECFGS